MVSSLVSSITTFSRILDISIYNRIPISRVQVVLQLYYIGNLCSFHISGDRVIGRDESDFTLDAQTFTVDPDTNARGRLSCIWSCLDLSTNQPCYSALEKSSQILLLPECIVTMGASVFSSGRKYQIRYG